MIRFKFKLSVLVAFFLGSLPFQYGTSSAQRTEFTSKACVAQIKIPKDDRVYNVLATTLEGRVHLTCPVNVKKEDMATIYVLNENGLCSHNTLFGYSIVSRKIVTGADAARLYNLCSGVSPSENKIPNKT